MAGRLSGAAMQVAIFLAYLKGLKRRNEFSVPTAKVAEVFGVSRYAVYRALKALECAGLIAVKRHRGRHPVVVLNASAGDTSLTSEMGRSAE
jgi:DNA-binding MarR family transcriptional regulator